MIAETAKVQNRNSTMLPLPILLYDSECTLCTRFKQGLERLPGTSNIHMESIYNENVYEEYPELSKENCKNEVHLIDESGIIQVGPEVVSNLVSRFPGVEKLSWLLDSEMGKQASTAFYKAVNRCKAAIKKRCHSCS